MTDTNTLPSESAEAAPTDTLDARIERVKEHRWITEGPASTPEGEEYYEVLTGMTEQPTWGTAAEWARGKDREDAWEQLLRTLEPQLNPSTDT